jgi:histone acetyltransferase (RNA polymerase elongator complex component)
MAKEGAYAPLELEDAVDRCAAAIEIFCEHGVPCIRVGLCASENLASESEVYGGANHAAIGELAMGEVYYKRICGELDKMGRISAKELRIYVPQGAVSKVSGQNRRNKTRICKKYGFNSVKILEKKEILGYNIILECN